MLADALHAYGIRDIFTSPGSRNAPLIDALERRGELSLYPVIDERSAAFIAAGFASVARRPVAIVCTSGTALLNYAPAVAECFYRRIPLVVISADRPARWIDQDDSQTLHQPGVFGRNVKGAFNLSGEIADDSDRWLVNRTINEALQLLDHGRLGPVHINISLAEPLYNTDDNHVQSAGPFSLFRKIDLLTPSPKLDVQEARDLARATEGKSVMIVGGFLPPFAEMNRAFAKLTRCGNVVILADPLANINCDDVISTPDLLFPSEVADNPAYAPDILITFGGALLSKNLKNYLRRITPQEHWHVGLNDMLIDSYFSLTQRIEIAEQNFFPRFANAMEYLSRQPRSGMVTPFKERWRETAREKRLKYNRLLDSGSDTGLTEQDAIHTVFKTVPADWNLQLSNGLTPRYAVRDNVAKFHRRDCNRGVSGIDGSVSTALGGAMAYKGNTLLITGDMSMQYDIAALSSRLLPSRLRIIVLNNGGGGIFRRIEATRHLAVRDRYLAMETSLPLRQLADGYGMQYYQASDRESLGAVLPRFTSDLSSPAILEIICRQE